MSSCRFDDVLRKFNYKGCLCYGIVRGKEGGTDREASDDGRAGLRRDGRVALRDR